MGGRSGPRDIYLANRSLLAEPGSPAWDTPAEKWALPARSWVAESWSPQMTPAEEEATKPWLVLDLYNLGKQSFQMDYILFRRTKTCHLAVPRNMTFTLRASGVFVPILDNLKGSIITSRDISWPALCSHWLVFPSETALPLRLAPYGQSTLPSPTLPSSCP